MKRGQFKGTDRLVNDIAVVAASAAEMRRADTLAAVHQLVRLLHARSSIPAAQQQSANCFTTLPDIPSSWSFPTTKFIALPHGIRYSRSGIRVPDIEQAISPKHVNKFSSSSELHNDENSTSSDLSLDDDDDDDDGDADDMCVWS